MGGETESGTSNVYALTGPSPRGRGNLHKPSAASEDAGSIPAWAGKPRRRILRCRLLRVHPRVGGETIRSDPAVEELHGPSPRGRGNLRSCQGGAGHVGSIPAWAGKPSRSGAERGLLWVHPRVGGETDRLGLPRPSIPGPSPRGRGNLLASVLESLLEGSIPAWAGKPDRNDSL